MIARVSKIELPFSRSAESWVSRSRAKGTRSASIAASEKQTLFLGPENRLAEAMIARMVQADVDGPLVLSGVSGSGKSLIVHCIVHYWKAGADGWKAAPKDKTPRTGKTGSSDTGPKDAGMTGLPVLVTHASDWVRHVDEQGEQLGSSPWRSSVDRISMFVMEDLEALYGHPRAQFELCLMLDELAHRQLPTVATSKLAPSQMFPLDPRLISRLMAGTLVQMNVPSIETKRVFVESLHLQGVDADRLEGRLEELVTLQQVQALARQWEVCPDRVTASTLPDVDETIRLCSNYFDLSVAQLRGKSRRQGTVFARHVTIVILRDLLQASFSEIGRALGGRDHSTVLHAYRKLSRQSKADPKLCPLVEELKAIICRQAALQR